MSTDQSRLCVAPRWALVSFAVFAALAAGCDREEVKPQVVEAVATVAELSGAVSIVRVGQTLVAQQGAGLIPADTVVTGPASTAVIRYRDGAELAVGENSRFRIELDQGRLTLKLEGGTVVSRGSRAGAAGGELRLFIETSFGSAEVLQGSELRFSLDGDAPSLQVIAGATTLLGADGKPTNMMVGQTLNFALGEVQGGEATGAPPAPPPEVRLSAVRGVPLIKVAGGKLTRAEGQVQVAMGTAFVIPRGARAVLASRGVRAAMDGVAEGQLTSATGTADAEKLELALARGSLDLRFSEGERELVLTGGKQRPVSLKAMEGAQAAFSRTPGGAVVLVRTGALQIESGGKSQRVQGGQLYELTASGPRVSGLSRPALTLAGGRKSTVFVDDVRPVGLEVPAGADGARIEVAASESFEDLLLDGRAYGAAVVVDSPRTGELHWRFKGADGAVLQQGSARFEADRGRSVLDETNPTAEVAETGLKATVYFQSALPSLRLSFPGRTGAQQYRVRIYRAGDLTAPIAERVVEGTFSVFEAGTVREGEYLWYAAPLDATGAELTGGRMNKLELVYDNNRRTIAISRPRPGEPPTGKVVETRGVAPLGAKLYINGKAVALDDKGRFSQQLPRTDVLVYRVVRDDRTESYWVRSLRRAP